MKKNTILYIVLLGVNILLCLVDLFAANHLPTNIVYAILVFVMITTPLYLFLQLKSFNKK